MGPNALGNMLWEEGDHDDAYEKLSRQLASSGALRVFTNKECTNAEFVLATVGSSEGILFLPFLKSVLVPARGSDIVPID